MQFFCFHRDRTTSQAARRATAQQHLTYMDGFDEALSLRGPTYNDRDELTGSVHIVELPSREAAWRFALEEPGYRAGVYRDVLLHRWQSALPNSPSQVSSSRGGARLYLVLGFEEQPAEATAGGIVPAGDVLVFGHLVSDDETLRLGTAAIVHARSPEQARAVLDGRALVDVEVYPWMFGIRA